MFTQSRTLIISTALALGIALPACAYAGNGVTFSDLDLAEAKVTFAQTEEGDAQSTADKTEKTEASAGEGSSKTDATADKTDSTAGKSDTSEGKTAESDSSKKDAKDATDSETASDGEELQLSDEEAEQLMNGIIAAFGSLDNLMVNTDRTIKVSGTAEVTVVPDKASFGVNVVTEAKTATKAQSDNAQAVSSLTDALAELKVDAKNIQTTATNLSPNWDYTSDESGKITGYVMTTRLEISNLDIDEVGTVIAELVLQGANGIDGPVYYSSKYDETYAEALTKAVESAKPKAETIAKAAELTLGPVVSITEGYEDRGYALATNERSVYDGAVGEDAAELKVDLNPGEITITANVEVVYSIK